jgi:hypothetical protein
MFRPRAKLKGEANRKEVTLCANIGEDRKSRFVNYCDHHGIKQTEAIKQMIDFCIGSEVEVEENKPLCIHYREFFLLILNDQIKLCSGRDDVDFLTSYKVNGQDFTLYATQHEPIPERDLEDDK